MPKKNEVRIPIKVDGKEILLTKKQVEKLNKSLDKTGTSAHTADRRLKGAAQASSGASKNFSKMAQGITGGLVPAYATLAANIFAIGAAFRFLQDAANYRILIQGQQEYATVTGESLKLLTSRLQDATGQQLAFAEAAQSAAIGRAAGLSSDQLSRLGSVAKNASIALGRDLTDSFNRLVRGSTKGEPELLDELGIILRLETATERYGLAIGKTKDELSTFERSQAVTNEVLRQGEEKFQDFSTELNAFTKLAKSFDDLINSLKNSLTGVAEFLAGSLSNNVVALSGAFGLLGTGIARAITPSAPRVDVEGAGAAARTKMGGIYSGKIDVDHMTPAQAKSMEATINRAYKKRSSTVIDFNKMSRREALQTLNIIKITSLEAELATTKGFKRLELEFKLTYAKYRMEHGQTMAFIKTTTEMMARGFSKLLSFVGYAGLIISLVGMIKPLMDMYKDPAIKKFEEAQKSIADSFKEQNEELNELNASLQDSAFFFERIVQQASFLSNFSYKGITKGFQSVSLLEQQKEESVRSNAAGVRAIEAQMGIKQDVTEGTNEYIDRRIDEGIAAIKVVAMTDTQKTILTETVGSLELMQEHLDDTSDSYKDLETRIDYFNEIIKNPDLGIEEYNEFIDKLFELETGASKAQEQFSKFANAGRIIKESFVEYNKALNSLVPTTGPVSTLLKQVKSLESAFGDLLDSDLKYVSAQITDEFGNVTVDDKKFKALTDKQKEKINSLLNSATESGVIAMIGKDAYDRAMEGENALADLLNLRAALASRLGELQTAAYGLLMDQKQLQMELNFATIGATKLQTKKLQSMSKEKDLERQIVEAKFLKQGFDFAGNAMSKEQLALNDMNLLALNQQLETLRLQRNELYLLGQAARNAFEGGMTTAFDDLITGKEGSLKDAMGKVAKGVFSGISKELSGQLSESVSNFMFGDKKLDPYKQGAIIIKQAHIDGIKEGLGSNSPTLTMNSETGQDSGFLGKAFNIGKSLFGFAKGGISPEYEKGGITPVYAATGGVFSGSKQGYPAIMHGNEAVVPLPDGKSIPVSGGMGGTVNVSVNMATGETSSTSNAEDMYQMGTAIAQAVENELEKQQRPGGMLAPY
jgi:hypothetical protein